MTRPQPDSCEHVWLCFWEQPDMVAQIGSWAGAIRCHSKVKSMTGIAGSTFNAAPSSTGSGSATRRSRVVPFVAEHRDRLAQLGWECLAEQVD
jgi:hypothetical protein